MMSNEIFDAIVKAYPAPAWTVLSELRDSTGWAGAGRSADAFAFGTWPSRGFRIVGFEIKSFRNDWLRELKNPAKSEGLASYADEWWLVADEQTAKLEEIPVAWGWATPGPKGLKTLKKPDPSVKAKDISRVFLMSIMRNLGKSYVPASRVRDEVNAKVEEEVNRRRDSNDFYLKNTREDLAELQKRVKEFEAAAGFSIGERWGDKPAEVGAIVRSVLDSRLKYHVQDVHKAAEGCAKILETLKALPIFQPKLEVVNE